MCFSFSTQAGDLGMAQAMPSPWRERCLGATTSAFQGVFAKPIQTPTDSLAGPPLPDRCKRWLGGRPHHASMHRACVWKWRGPRAPKPSPSLTPPPRKPAWPCPAAGSCSSQCTAAPVRRRHACAHTSSGVKSFSMLKVCRISSGVLPLIMFATVRHVRSSSGLMLR